MEILHTSSYYQIICLPGEQIIRIRRMKKPFSSSFDLTAEMTEVNAVLDRVRGPHFGVLLDMRETPGAMIRSSSGPSSPSVRGYTRGSGARRC